MVGSGLTF